MAPTDKLDAVMSFYATCREWFGDNKRVDEIELGLAVKLQTWCACHMGCGGFIPNCLEWDRKTWQKEAGIERKIFRKYLGKSEYFRAENGGVRVLIHDAQREAKAQETSRKRQIAARARWDAYHAANADANADADIQKDRNSESQNSEISLACEPNSKNRPQDAQEVVEYARTLDGFMSAEQREKCARTFFDDKQGNGWRDARGNVIVNWKAAFRAFSQRWQTRAANDRPTVGNIRNQNCNASHIHEY